MVAEVDVPNLSSIVLKLGHDLEVIRERALKSILFKLEHKIIDLEQLCIEPHLCRHLLTWFNQEVVSDEERVLHLLLLISKHPISGNRLISIGALPFLESLRENSPSSLFSLIDNIISSLSCVPPLPPHFDLQEIDSSPSSNNSVSSSLSSPSLSPSLYSSLSQNSSVSEQLKRQAKLLLDVEENVDLNSNGTEFTFPPIPICREDEHFLKEISVKIQMTDPKMVALCLTQLRDEVLQDFPPEILLQKTDIFKGLLMQLKPSPVDQQLLTTLREWVTLLKSSLRLSVDHSFSSSPPSPSLSPPSSPSDSHSDSAFAQTHEPHAQCDSAFSAKFHSEPARVIAPTHAAHHILIKALALAHHYPILGEVVCLCKSLVSLVKPSDFGIKDNARFKEYTQVMEKIILQYKEKITQDPLCTSYLSIVLELLKTWPITDITSVISLSFSKLLVEIFGDDTLYLMYPNFRDEFRPIIAVLEYPEDPFRAGSLSPIATVASPKFPNSSISPFLSSYTQHLFEALRRSTSPAELIHSVSQLHSFCISDSFHLQCVWEIQWEPYFKRFLASQQIAPESDQVLKPLVEFLELMALSRTSLSASVLGPNINFLVQCAQNTLAPLLFNESKRRTYNLRKSILAFLKALVENPSISLSLHSSLCSLTPILLSVACTTSVETPTVANLTTFASLDASDSSQARLSLSCLAALASYRKNEQVWKTYSWDFIAWIVRVFASKRTGSSFRGKSIVRASLLCLQKSGYKIDWTASSPDSPMHTENNPKFVDDIADWCFSLLGDREAAIRGLSCSVLSCIAAHPLPSSFSLRVHDSDSISHALDIGCDESECYEVRSEAFRLLANIAINFSTSGRDTRNDDDEDINEAIGHRRIITALQQSHFFSQLVSFLKDSRAAPKFLHSLAHLIWVLICMDNVEVPRALMVEGVYVLMIELLSIEGYWKKYSNHWFSFWETQAPLSPSISPAHIPEWAKHQWQAINEGYISGACRKVFESIRVILYDDVNMRNYFLKDSKLVSYCLDILLTDNQEFSSTKTSALLLLNNLAFQASDAERDHLLSAVPSGMQISIWQVLAFVLDSYNEDESIKDSVCCLISALLDKASPNNDKALEIPVIDRVPRKPIVPQENMSDISIIYAKSAVVGAVIAKNLVQMYRKASSQHSLSTTPRFHALQNILGFSSSAKHAAIHLNLLQDLRTAIEQRINHLVSLSHSLESDEASLEDKISDSILDLLSHIPILRNILHDSDTARQAAYHADFNEIFYSLVYYLTHTMDKQVLRLLSLSPSSSSSSSSSLAQLQITLLSESISLLQVYSHQQSDTFKTSLFLHQYNGLSKKISLKDSALVAHSQKSVAEKSCILVMICDFALKPKMESNDEVFKHITACLGDVCDSSSVRGFVLKSLVFQRCVDIIHKQASSKQIQPPKLHIALQFFIALSFEPSAQVYLMKIKGLLEYLFDLLECKDEAIRVKCMFLLRNLSYSSENKPFLLSNDRGLRLITNSLVYPNVKLQCFSTNLLWSLLYSNQKASVKLKKVKGLVENLQQVLSGTKKSGQDSKIDTHRNKHLLQIQENVEMIFKLLGLE